MFIDLLSEFTVDYDTDLLWITIIYMVEYGLIWLLWFLWLL